MPTLASGGVKKTAFGTVSKRHSRVVPENRLSASMWPSAIATGVRFSRLVTSPMA